MDDLPKKCDRCGWDRPDDKRVHDKWGPAGCIYVGRGLDGTKTYVFFGWASS